jgi:SAM-dependent methyltransferase
VIHLARQGYRVTGFDFLPEMVRAAEKNVAAAGVSAEFFAADMAELDRRGRTFDGIYVTPLVYSFVPGRARRVRSLDRLGRHLARGGSAVFSAHLLTSPSQYMQAALAWARHARRGRGCEFGDWFTWFLRPDGTIGKSYSHLFTVASVLAEARQAGFRACRKDGAYFVVADFGG